MVEVWEMLENEYQDKLMHNRWSLSIILNKKIMKILAKSFKVANMLHILEGGVNFGVTDHEEAEGETDDICSFRGNKYPRVHRSSLKRN
jgi:hypothetical protein